jgi:hypothetical protein
LPYALEQLDPEIETLTTPFAAAKVEPGGNGGLPVSVTVTFGVPPAPPVYFNWVVHPLMADPVQVPVVVVKAICRNTKIDLATPAAAPAESSTRITNEKVPAAVGLPVVLPPADNARPGGSAPELIDHLYGFTPPAAPDVTVP